MPKFVVGEEYADVYEAVVIEAENSQAAAAEFHQKRIEQARATHDKKEAERKERHERPRASKSKKGDKTPEFVKREFDPSTVKIRDTFVLEVETGKSAVWYSSPPPPPPPSEWEWKSRPHDSDDEEGYDDDDD